MPPSETSESGRTNGGEPSASSFRQRARLDVSEEGDVAGRLRRGAFVKNEDRPVALEGAGLIAADGEEVNVRK